MIRTTGLMEQQGTQHTERQGQSRDRLPCQRLIFTHTILRCAQSSLSQTPLRAPPPPHTHAHQSLGPRSSTDPLSPEDLPRTPLSQFPHLPSHARWKLSLFTALRSSRRFPLHRDHGSGINLPLSLPPSFGSLRIHPRTRS